MAGEAHLKVAAGNIRRAAQDKQNELHELRTAISRMHGDTEREINAVDISRSEKEAAAASREIDDAARARLLKQIQDDRRHIDERRMDKQRLTNDMQRQVSNVEQQIQNLLSLASTVERTI